MSSDAQSWAEPELTLPERYRVRRHLATGGMASVWCADDLVLGRTVAIKVLAERFAGDEMAVRRFKREARAAARVSTHAHVVTIYDVGDLPGADDRSASGRAFIVMEHLAGGTVADAIRVGAVRRREAVRWLREAAAALDFAHGHGIVHRDVKPDNFLLDRSRVLHVADFGIARLLSEDTITSAGELFGTAAYLSPEQALGLEATGASDRYALAVAAFELLAGERPFTATHFTAQARQHIEDPPPRATGRDRTLPEGIDDVLARGMAKQPDERFESAGEMINAIEAALAGVPVVAPAGRRLGRSGRGLGRSARALPPRPAGSRPAPARPAPARPAPARPDPARPAPARPDPARPDPAGSTPSRPIPSRPAAPRSAAQPRSSPQRPAQPAAPRPPVLPAARAGSDPDSITSALLVAPATGARAGAPATSGTSWPHRRHMGRVIALAALLVAAVGVAAVALTGGGRARSGRTVASRPAERLTARPPGRAHKRTHPAQVRRPSPVTATTTPAAESPAQLQETGYQEILAGDYQTAIATLREAVQVAPQNSLTYAYGLYNLGHALVLAGDPSGAVPILEERLKIPNQTPVVRRMLDVALKASGQVPAQLEASSGSGGSSASGSSTTSTTGSSTTSGSTTSSTTGSAPGGHRAGSGAGRPRSGGASVAAPGGASGSGTTTNEQNSAISV